VDFGGRAFTPQWPGAYFRAAFEGTEVFLRVGKSDEILHIVVDELPALLLTKPEPGAYEVRGLRRGRHAIAVFVATESQDGPNTFGGFGVPKGERALEPAERRRQIEFIGDSHTVGYGDISGKRQCTTDEVWADTDDTQAFGPEIARRYDADYEVNAISGRGVVRNYNGFAADTLPEAYPYVLFDKAQRYNDPGWKPQVVVIALGTNDFSTALNPGERWKTREDLHADFEATYARFLGDVRARNPQALMIVWATGMAGGEIEAEAQKAVGQRVAEGDGRIAFVPVDGLSFTACDWHPSVADHAVIAEKIERAIDADRQVWAGR
jgi:lysophospholipase L1-like esterase